VAPTQDQPPYKPPASAHAPLELSQLGLQPRLLRIVDRGRYLFAFGAQLRLLGGAGVDETWHRSSIARRAQTVVPPAEPTGVCAQARSEGAAISRRRARALRSTSMGT